MTEENKFEWDSNKATSNLTKHGISFETARKAFYDYFAIDLPDKRFKYGEDRYNLIGMVDKHLLIVSYTMRKDVIRIISARGAEPHEKRKYYKYDGRMGEI